MAFKSLEIKVFGKVQGVGFRYYTRKKAQALDLKGYVQNKPDGSVFIEVEGQEEQIDLFVLWCENGPPWARVSKMQVQEVPASGYENFKIK